MTSSNAEHSAWPERGKEAFLLAVFFGLIYLSTVTTSILGHDAAEFATIYADGGYAHPPGYPLYSLYLHGMSWLPLESPATGASVATCLLGVAAVVVLHNALRSWGAGRFGALFGAIVFGLSTNVWLYHTQPEVFALNHLVAAGILWFAGPKPPTPGRKRVLVLGVLAGLGLANHHTIALMAPIGLWGVYRGIEETDSSALLTLSMGLGALLVGLVPYVYVPIVHTLDSGWHWGAPDHARDILHLFLRRDYGTFSMALGESPTDPGVQLRFLATSLSEDMLYVPILFAGVGAYASWSSSNRTSVPDDSERSRRNRRWRTVTLLASLVLTGPVFATLLTRHPDGINAPLLRRFHMLPALHLAFLGGLGADHLSRRILTRRTTRILLFGSLTVAAIAVGLPAHTDHHAPTVAHYIRDTFTHLPRRSVVIGTGDHVLFGSMYFQRALGERTDVTYISAQLLAHRWYHSRTVGRSDIEFEYRGTDVGTDRLFRAVHRTQRPLFVTRRFHDELLAGWPTTPHGTLIRVHGPGDRPLPPRRAYRWNRRLYAKFVGRPRPHAGPDTWSRFILEHYYAPTWGTLADALSRTGAKRLAAQARTFEHRFDPWTD